MQQDWGVRVGSRHEFACGKVEVCQNGGTRVSMWREGDGFKVRAYRLGVGILDKRECRELDYAHEKFDMMVRRYL